MFYAGTSFLAYRFDVLQGLLAWTQGDKPAGSADFTPSVIGALPES